MQLWNDYEGKTIADVYTLGQLLRPEGRNALFALAEGPESPAIVRLTESLNDEGQMLECWRHVGEVKQENLVTIKRFGETTFAGTPLTYAVMEPTDATLSDLLKERPLTEAEAMQVAKSVVAALKALHANGMVHEHVDAANVVAVGETVKLRADCVRECVVDTDHLSQEEWLELVQRDVHDLGLLLLRVLTLEKKLKPGIRLQAPFDRIVGNATNGSWGLAEIEGVLTPAVVRPLVPETVGGSPRAAASVPMESRGFVPEVRQERAHVDAPLLYQRRVAETATPERKKLPMWLGLGGAAVLTGAFVLHSVSGRPASAPPAQESVPAAAVARPVSQPIVQKAPAASVAAATVPQAGAGSATTAGSEHPRAGWYVIAYTFNHEEQAWKRAEAILKRYPSLHPEVIAPGGREPFLVALGGPMSRGEAEMTRSRARQVGMPRDTFVRNYKGS